MNLSEVINTQRKGRCLMDAQQAFQDVVKACIATGKKGKFTISLEIKAAEDSTVVLRDEITTRIPKPEVSSTTFYADEQGALFREDPRQPEFPEVARVEAVNR